MGWLIGSIIILTVCFFLWIKKLSDRIDDLENDKQFYFNKVRNDCRHWIAIFYRESEETKNELEELKKQIEDDKKDI